jgi:hypothetical protein
MFDRARIKPFAHLPLRWIILPILARQCQLRGSTLEPLLRKANSAYAAVHRFV